jgi:hypothetical protein
MCSSSMMIRRMVALFSSSDDNYPCALATTR